jgi:L-seryl-tRNA(Ser) seleniumtransferase
MAGNLPEPDAPGALLRRLPAIGALLADPRLAGLPPALVADVARDVVGRARDAVRAGADTPDDVVADVLREVNGLLDGGLVPVHNATGVVLHTNLGRAPWSEAARDAANRAMGYADLELDLEHGRRGGRGARVAGLLRHLVGAEDALVVNNGAAGVLLAVTAFARGRDVLVSRGELVEIGGSFRIPDVVAACGARLVEVGTTNRTHERDYLQSSATDPALMLSVHPSNFRVQGFVTTLDRAARVKVAREVGVPVVEDQGSGDLDGRFGEPSVRDAVAAGVDVVVFSADKLLGGPQAGVLVGRAASIERLRRHPLYRALRVDKVVEAALGATLADWARGRPTPTEARVRADAAILEARAAALSALLAVNGVAHRVETDAGAVGGGARPDVALAGPVIAVPVSGADAAHRRLRTGRPAVVARIRDGALILDPRTLDDDALAAVASRVADAVGAG